MTDLRVIESPSAAERTRNVTARENCRWCDQTGYVVAAIRRDRFLYRGVEKFLEAEELAPCPYCERGFGEEFPDPTKQEKAPPCRPPWPAEGYWQGRSTADVRPLLGQASATKGERAA